MRRDVELDRRILLAVGDSQRRTIDGDALVDDAHGLEAVAYNAELLQQAGLMESHVIRAMNGDAVSVSLGPLTWKGNEWVDSVRDPKIWGRVKRKIASTVGTASFDIILELAKQLAVKAVGL